MKEDVNKQSLIKEKVVIILMYLTISGLNSQLIFTTHMVKSRVSDINLTNLFGRLKTGVFFTASCFGYRAKGVCPLLLPLVSLVSRDFSNTISQKS